MSLNDKITIKTWFKIVIPPHAVSSTSSKHISSNYRTVDQCTVCFPCYHTSFPLLSVFGLLLGCLLQRWSFSPSSLQYVCFATSLSPPNQAGMRTTYPYEHQVSLCPASSFIFFKGFFLWGVFVLVFFLKSLWFAAGDPQEGSSLTGAMCSSGPQGFRKHFMSRKLHSDNQPQDPERLFQRCFTATVTGVRVESPS